MQPERASNRKLLYWQAILAVAVQAEQGDLPAAQAALVSVRALEEAFAQSEVDESVLDMALAASAEVTAEVAAETVAFFPVFGHICDRLGFAQKDAICLAVSLANVANGKPVPVAQKLMAMLHDQAAEGLLDAQDAINLSFWENPAQVAAVLDFAFGRVPNLPTGVALSLSQPGVAYHHKALLEELTPMLHTALDTNTPLVVALTGEKGVGRCFMAQTLAKRLGFGTLCVEASVLPMPAPQIQALCTVAALYGAVICFANVNFTNANSEKQAMLREQLNIVLQHTTLVFITATQLHGFAGRFSLLARAVSALQPEERLCALQGLLQGALPTEQLARVANLYHLNMQKIVSIASRLRAEALAGALCEAQLLAAVQAENTVALSQNATILTTNKRFADVVLPEAQMTQLSAIIECVKNRETVYRDWDFQQTIPYGKGVAALFYGASGTGKTLAASVLANELGLALYRVDLSQLTSKYIGETQKNIARIFDEAQQSDCILFFDEADALFSRRSDGAQAQDKQINGEIAYLLQRTETYEGVMILATNLLQNFDEAFRRRIQYIVHFPLPDAALRRTMWQKVFPAKAPVREVDEALLAEQLELSGAGVRNIALSAAYMAASSGTQIDTNCCVQAARLEYAKQGKTFPRYLDDMYPQERSAL